MLWIRIPKRPVLFILNLKCLPKCVEEVNFSFMDALAAPQEMTPTLLQLDVQQDVLFSAIQTEEN